MTDGSPMRTSDRESRRDLPDGRVGAAFCLCKLVAMQLSIWIIYCVKLRGNIQDDSKSTNSRQFDATGVEEGL